MKPSRRTAMHGKIFDGMGHCRDMRIALMTGDPFPAKHLDPPADQPFPSHPSHAGPIVPPSTNSASPGGFPRADARQSPGEGERTERFHMKVF